MAKLRITFEVDNIALFDRLKAMDSDMGPIGERVIGAMLTGNPCWSDGLGMAFYGVVHTGTEVIDEPVAAD